MLDAFEDEYGALFNPNRLRNKSDAFCCIPLGLTVLLVSTGNMCKYQLNNGSRKRLMDLILKGKTGVSSKILKDQGSSSYDNEGKLI